MTGFNSKRDAAADKLQDGKCKLCVDGCAACDARAQPAQEQRQPLTRQQCLRLAVHPLMTIESVVRVVEAAHGIGDQE